MVKTIDELLDAAKTACVTVGRPRIAVAAAQDEEVLEAVESARKDGLADGVLIGDTSFIKKIASDLNIDITKYQVIQEPNPAKAALMAVDLVRRRDATLVMKGLLDTAVLLKAVLNKEEGLHAGRLVSHIGVICSPYYHKLLLLTDAAINIAPTWREKVDIILNAVDCAKAIGIEKPKIAILAAVEKVNPEKMPCTTDAAILTQMNRRGQIPACIVDGPLALDNAISLESARTKGIESPVAGDADILLAPNIEAGNVLYKSVINLGGAKGAGVVMGAGVPIVLTSRADTAETKLASIALAVLASITHFHKD